MRQTLVALAVFVLATSIAVARADDGVALPAEWQLGVGPVAGAMWFDADLANYRWDIAPAAQSGMEMTVSRGWIASSVRLWRAHTTQSSGIPGESQAPRVNLTGVDVAAQGRVLGYRAFELWGAARGGKLHLGYNPDQLTFSPGGGAAPVTVAYAPVTAWTFGLGVDIRAPLTRQLALAVQAEQSTFALDTAHRSGNEIVEARERFSTWGLRLQLSWWFRLS